MKKSWRLLMYSFIIIVFGMIHSYFLVRQQDKVINSGLQSIANETRVGIDICSYITQRYPTPSEWTVGSSVLVDGIKCLEEVPGKDLLEYKPFNLAGEKYLEYDISYDLLGKDQ